MTKKSLKVQDRCVYATMAHDFPRFLTSKKIEKISSSISLQRILSAKLSISDEKSKNIIKTFLEQIVANWLLAFLPNYQNQFMDTIIKVLDSEIKQISSESVFPKDRGNLAAYIYEYICEEVGNTIYSFDLLEFDELYQSSRLGKFIFDEGCLVPKIEDMMASQAKAAEDRLYPKMSHLSYSQVKERLAEIKKDTEFAPELLDLIERVRNIDTESGSSEIVKEYFSDDDVNDLKQIAKRLKPAVGDSKKSKYDDVYLHSLLSAYHRDEDLYVFRYQGE